jgi:PHD/YefM family antitoxin component YafN of YafNO toxin-antitoxin module
MNTFNTAEAQVKLHALIDEAIATHQPIMITGEKGNAVLVAEDDWKAINETLHLLSVPGMRVSIQDGMTAKIDSCDRTLD